MSWVVESLQSKLDEVQSSIDSRLETTKKSVVEEEPEEEVAWPSLTPSGGGYPVEGEAVKKKSLSECVSSCASSLAHAEAGARELELRLKDTAESREAWMSGRKDLVGKMKAASRGEAAASELAAAVKVELEESGRRGKELEFALSRAFETIGRPAMSANREVTHMKRLVAASEKPPPQWRLVRAALRHRGLLLLQRKRFDKGALCDELETFRTDLKKSQQGLVKKIDQVDAKCTAAASRVACEEQDDNAAARPKNSEGLATIERVMAQVCEEAASAVLDASKRRRQDEKGDGEAACSVASLRAEISTANRRASEASAVAKEALAELDRERSNRKNREQSSLKTLNEQLRASRLEAGEARELAANLSAQLDAETDAHVASRAVTDCHVASASGLRAEIAQLADKMVAAFTASRTAEQRAREVQRRLDDLRIDKDKRIESLDASLREARRNVMMEQQQNYRKNETRASSFHAHGTGTGGKAAAELASSMESGGLHASSNGGSNNNSIVAARKATGRGLRAMSRLLFVFYALALHILVYASYHRCGLTSSSQGGGGGSGMLPSPRSQ